MAELDERYLDVTVDNVLRIPLTLWIGWWIMARHWVLFGVGLASMLTAAHDAARLASSGSSWLAMAIQLPIMLLIFAAGRRKPNAPSWVRLVWRHGIKIMLFSLVLGWAWLAMWLYQTETWQRWPELFYASTALLDFAIAYGAYSSPYIRQVFSEFPD
nr:DUF2919 family protein [uncultured Rhodoferax sp.]